LRAAGFKDLKNSQAFWLARIDLDGNSVVDLAERSNVSKQVASKLVSELVPLGYLSTSRALSDGRAILVQFTTRGRIAVQQSIEWFADIKREYCRRVGVQAYRALKRALRTRGERSPLSNDE
jgi:DNA-binding MarR family transcriptional regulator